jgi:hypothetical protein
MVITHVYLPKTEELTNTPSHGEDERLLLACFISRLRLQAAVMT